MTRATANKFYRSFVRGLITEASPLTFPENSSIAEDNTIIYKRGNRSRRLGVQFEDSYSLNSSLISQSSLPSLAIKGYRWNAVAEDSSISFIVSQIGRYLYFYDLAVTPLSNGLKSFSVDLNTFAAPNQSDISSTKVTFSSGKGLLFVVGEKTEPFSVEYSPDTDTIVSQQIYIQIRDFQGVDDGLANDEEPLTLSAQHRYNLKNQGWNTPANAGGGSTVSYFDSFGNISTYVEAGDEPITSYFTNVSRYPSNNKQWWAGKDTDGNFSPTILNKFSFGNNRAPRGHYIVNAFYIDRSAMSGVPSLPVDLIIERPQSTAFAFGRTFFGCNSTVYFSQVLDSKAKAGFCYQEADPTSEDFSELLPNDGGVIPIPEAGKINYLVSSGSGVVVFATNGLWFISGTSAGFTATDISLSKISPIGTESPESIVDVNGMLLWWSRIGIQSLQAKSGLFGPVEGAFDKTTITEDTIQTFYNHEISDTAKKYAKGQYDAATNTVQWLYASDDTPGPYLYDRVLNYDVTLNAFYPWSISSDGSYLVDIFTTPEINSVSDDSTPVRGSFFKYTCVTPTSTFYGVTFALFSNTNFADWGTQSYLSYVETGYELLEDAMRKKQTLWVVPVFRRTEENYVANGDDYDLDRPSSCMFQVKWDWASSSNSNKWSTKREAYRFTRLPFFDEDNLAFDTGYPVVITKQKVRGSGRAIQFRFESDRIGYDFDLLGWSVAYSGNTQP